MIGPGSNDLEALELELDESRHLEEVDKYYFQKLCETCTLLSNYHKFILLTEIPHQPPSSEDYKEFANDLSAYDMERKNVDLINIIKQHGKSHEAMTHFCAALNLMQKLRVSYNSQYFIGV